MASDYMVFNVTNKDIRVRMAAVDQEIWPTEPTRPREVRSGAGDVFTDFVIGGKEPMSDLVSQIYSEFNERNGTNVAVP